MLQQKKLLALQINAVIHSVVTRWFCFLKDTLLVQLPGNAAVIKPSEVSLHSSKVMEELLPLYMDKVHSFL